MKLAKLLQTNNTPISIQYIAPKFIYYWCLHSEIVALEGCKNKNYYFNHKLFGILIQIFGRQ